MHDLSSLSIHRLSINTSLSIHLVHLVQHDRGLSDALNLQIQPDALRAVNATNTP